jgi:hypothetical protein
MERLDKAFIPLEKAIRLLPDHRLPAGHL